MYVCVYDGTVHKSKELRAQHKKDNKYNNYTPYDIHTVELLINDYIQGNNDISIKYGITYNKIKKLILESDNTFRTMNETFILKYGVPYASQSNKVKEKVSNTLKSKSAKEKYIIELKKQATCLMNHGVTHAQKNKEICQRTQATQKETMMKKYGVDHPCKVKEIQERSEVTRKNTMMSRYSVVSPAQIDSILQKMEETNLKRYGVRYFVNHPKCTALNYSSIHKRVYNYFTSLDYVCENEYGIGDGKLLYDIFIPKLNLLVEVNGDYWHGNPLIYDANYKIRTNLYARDKWEQDKHKNLLAVNKGYNTLTLWENQINDDSYISIIKQYIKENYYR